MREKIEMDVCILDKEGVLEFVYEDNFIKLELNGKYICSFDYNNFTEVIKRMLEIWGGLE